MKDDFATKITLDGSHIDRQKFTYILGVWIREDPSCLYINTQQVKRGHLQVSNNVKIEVCWHVKKKKLLHVYLLHVRTSMEYCSVAWHNNITQAQIVFLKIILGSDCPMKEDGHFNYHREKYQNCHLVLYVFFWFFLVLFWFFSSVLVFILVLTFFQDDKYLKIRVV